MKEDSHCERPLPEPPEFSSNPKYDIPKFQGNKNIYVPINNHTTRASMSANLNTNNHNRVGGILNQLIESDVDSFGHIENNLFFNYKDDKENNPNNNIMKETNKENIINESLATIFEKVVSSPIKSKNPELLEKELNEFGQRVTSDKKFAKSNINITNEGVIECLGYLMSKVQQYKSKENKYKNIIKDKDHKLNVIEKKLNDTVDVMDEMKKNIKESSKMVEKFRYNESAMALLNSKENSVNDDYSGDRAAMSQPFSINDSKVENMNREVIDQKKKVKALQIDKQVLKEIIREMVCEEKGHQDKTLRGKSGDNNNHDNKRNWTRSISKSSKRDQDEETKRKRRTYHRTDSYQKNFDGTDDENIYMMDNKNGSATKIIKNPKFAKIVSLEN